jgi:hypothetical protein
MVVTTISCDAVILCCASCQAETVAAFAVARDVCRTCNGTMLFERRCAKAFSLHKDSILIRCIAENKDGWCCEDRGGRDFCPEHVHLADPKRVAQPTPQIVGEA